MKKSFKTLIKDSQTVNYQHLYRQVSFGSLLNTYSILYFSQFKFVFNNYPQLFHYSKKLLGRRIFNFLVQKTLGKQFLSGNNLEASKDVAR